MASRSVSRPSSATISKGDKLSGKLAEVLTGAVLPGDPALDGQAVHDAALFLLEAARQRKSSAPSIALESVSGTASDRFMRIAVINDDMPFLVDSIAATLAEQGLTIGRLVHPVVRASRDDDGVLTDIGPKSMPGEKRESMVYLETDRADAKGRRALAGALEETLAEVRRAVADWPKLQARMLEDADLIDEGEPAELLRWLNSGMFTQLGYEVRSRKGDHSNKLGICRASAKTLLGEPSYKRAFSWFDAAKTRNLLVIKSNRIARVHRRVPLDLFIVPLREKGRVTALSIHCGIWTSAALTAPPSEVPCLRSQLGEIGAKFGFDPAGHAGKALVHALTAMPHDVLISFDKSDLERVATTMMSLVERPRPHLALVTAPLERHLYAFVWLPRDSMSTTTRMQIQTMLVHAADGPVLDWSLKVEGSNLALLQFVIDIREGAKIPDEAALDAALGRMLLGWSEAVEDELAAHEEPMRAQAIAARYAEAFPIAFRTRYGAAEAANDIIRLRQLAAEPGETGPRRGVRLHARGGAGNLHLKLYQRSGAIALSDAVPALENFGFRVIEDVPTSLDMGGEHLGAIHDFELELPKGRSASDLLAQAPMIEEALAAVLNGEGEDDAFNRLIPGLGHSAREANWLRAFYRYLRQAGMNFGIPTAVDALSKAPMVTRGLIALFRAAHDPKQEGARDKVIEGAQAMITDGLAKVSAINDDRLLRAYRALVAAILRTNAFAPAGQVALAFKLDSALVPGLPKPVPWREIFVYSPRVEGIHLRAGPIARGGLRWSDRRDDFRTEVLGLMKAQRVKNAVIVPTGAKGGFYPKQLPDPVVDRDGWLAEGRASYQVFVRTLLSITDNIVEGKVIQPAHVVIRDGEDPYFVVAADKGTATFSDTANAIADEFDFWLDDAFASGGSKGYDHKAMGITAKGAWMSVQRHFLELGVDVQKDQVRVAGCGDMSGDVFGNGMLLSKSIKLVAAFDHRHIFLDPDPDAVKAHAERARMFVLPRSSWDDYDKKLISRGGGVFPRSMKAIPLSKPVRAMLGLEAETIDPDSLITSILKANVDLLWFGGIGTYVKGELEANSAVGDPANDALRVNGSDLRAQVIGEGANLGCTQAGRIEFALRGNDGLGGRINTDFIDNSAGVDCSDNEVNIKIALASARRAGRLSEASRVKLLVEMTDAVGAHVLEDNRLQALGLSIAGNAGAAGTGSYLRLMEVLEERGQLDRRTEGLAEAEVFKRRAADGHGLTRPELAVLLSSAKLELQAALEASDVVDDPGLESELIAYFPEAMRTKFRKDILGHRLRREIIATSLANRIVNRIGMIHPFELVEEEGASLAQVSGAFVAAERLFGMAQVWQRLETAAMPEGARIVAMRRSASALRSHMADLLRAGVGTAPPSETAAALAPAVHKLSEMTASLLGGEARAQSQRVTSELIASGVLAVDAAMIAHLSDLDGAVGLAHLSLDSGLTPEELTRAFSDVGARLGLDWAQQAAARIKPTDPWERLLVAGLARDFQQMRLDFLRRICGKRCTDPSSAVERWAKPQGAAIRQFRMMVARAQTAVPTAPAMLAQIAGQARNLLGR